MILKFKISIPLKHKILNWQCRLHFKFHTRNIKQRKKVIKTKDLMKKIEIIEDDLHHSSSHY